MTLADELLNRLTPWRQASTWYIAYSGGLDSTVLLHVLASLSRIHRLPPIRALHVHHGLQSAAESWPEYCRQVCARLDIAFESIAVTVEPAASIEQAARQARYQAFSQRLQVNDVLLLAQHQDDQAETLLFRLLRGAGVKGLAAMPESRVLGRGRLVRPLLHCSRRELEAYAREQQLEWVEDPSNEDTHFTRNFLRNRLMPSLRERWPQLTRTLAATAERMGEAQQLLDERAQEDLQSAQADSVFPWLGIPVLTLSALRVLSEPRQRNLLRYWLSDKTVMPDEAHWHGWQTLRDAAADAMPVWALHKGELRRSGDHLFWLSGDWLVSQGDLDTALCSRQGALSLPGNGTLSWSCLPEGSAWRIGYRQGGEIIHLPGRGHRALKKLFNDQALPTFVRDRLPLLFLDDELVAVANFPLWRAEKAGVCELVWLPSKSRCND